jgi:serine protease Do
MTAMKHLHYLNLAGLALLLAFTANPNQLHAQTQQEDQDSTTEVTRAPSTDPAVTWPEAECGSVDVPAEQIDDEVRNIGSRVQGVLQQEFGDLNTRVQEEAEMNSPELQRLQPSLSAQFPSKESQLQADASELADRAAELADMAQEKIIQTPGQDSDVLVMDSKDGASGWLGVEIAEVSSDTAKNLKLSAVRGVMVKDVEPDSPAAQAGLKDDDVITHYDGQVVEGTVQFRRLVRETPAGRTVTLAVWRDGSSQNISVDLGERSAFSEKKMKGKIRGLDNVYAFSMPNPDFSFAMPAINSRMPVLGINAEDVSGQLGSYFGAPDGAGILIREVSSGSAAEKAGLKAGDVIIKVDGKAVRTLGDLRAQLRDKGDQKSVKLGILRKGSEMNFAVAVEKPEPLQSTHIVQRAQF